jgi:hypothetical protein
MKHPRLLFIVIALVALALIAAALVGNVRSADAATITISSGGTYTGTWESTTTAPAVTVTTTQPVIIENCTVRGKGHGISVPSGANVTVRNCYAEATWAGTAGSGRFVWAGNGVANLTMENNEIHRFAGLKVVGGSPASIRVVANRVRNIQGDPTNCCGFMQFAQFDNVRGGQVTIAWNEIINTPGQSRVEDVLSFFGGSGGLSSSSRWKVFSNLIWGAWNEAPATMPGFSGGGIMHGDAGEQGEGWIETHNNVVLGTGNYGISVAGGSGHWVHDNLIVSSGRLSDGRVVASTNNGGPVGIVLWKGPFSQQPATNNTFGTGNNRVGLWKPTYNGGSRNDWWWCSSSDCAPASLGNVGPQSSNVTLIKAGQPITWEDELAGFNEWDAQRAAFGVVVGIKPGGPPPTTTTTTTAPPTTTTTAPPTTTTTAPPTTTTTTQPPAECRLEVYPELGVSVETCPL